MTRGPFTPSLYGKSAWYVEAVTKPGRRKAAEAAHRKAASQAAVDSAVTSAAVGSFIATISTITSSS